MPNLKKIGVGRFFEHFYIKVLIHSGMEQVAALKMCIFAITVG